MGFLFAITLKQQEKPTKCGTKAADVKGHILADKHVANPLKIGAFATCAQCGEELAFVGRWKVVADSQ